LLDHQDSNPGSSLELTTIIIILTGSLVISLLVIFLAFLIVRRKRVPDKRQREPGTENHARDNYMELVPQRNTVVQLYAELQNEYEEIEDVRI